MPPTQQDTTVTSAPEPQQPTDQSTILDPDEVTGLGQSTLDGMPVELDASADPVPKVFGEDHPATQAEVAETVDGQDDPDEDWL